MIKWLSNYWYHYKFRTIICAFLIVILGVTVYEFATTEKYDMKVYLYLSQSVSSEVEHSLETTVEQYYEQDGKQINVQVINFSYDPYSASGDSRVAFASALAGELTMKEHFIYITDEYRFEELDNNDVFTNVFQQNKLFNKYDNKAYSLKGGNFEKKFIENLKKNNVVVEKMPKLYISVLTPPEKDSANYKNYVSAEKLVELIVKKDR